MFTEDKKHAAFIEPDIDGMVTVQVEVGPRSYNLISSEKTGKVYMLNESLYLYEVSVTSDQSGKITLK